MATFKSHNQMRAEFTAQKFNTLSNNGQVIVESREEAEKLQARLNHSRRNTLTDRSFNR